MDNVRPRYAETFYLARGGDWMVRQIKSLCRIKKYEETSLAGLRQAKQFKDR